MQHLAALALVVLLACTSTTGHAEGPPSPVLGARNLALALELGKAPPKPGAMAFKLAKQAPSSAWAQLVAAAAFYDEGNLIWARKAVTKALALQPSLVPAKLLDARIQYDLGEYLPAAESFESLADIEGLPPAMDAAVTYYLGLTYYKQGKLQEASRALETVGDAGGPTLAKASDLYLDNVYRMLGYPVDRLVFSVSLASEYDSNVILTPLEAEGISGQDAFRFSLAPTLVVRPLAGKYVLQGTLSGKRTFSSNDVANDLDATIGSADVFFHAPTWLDLKVGYHGDIMGLDGGPRAEEPDAYVFAESHGGFASFVLGDGETYKITPKLSATYKTFHTLRRDVLETKLDLNVGLFFKKGTWKVFLTPMGVHHTPMSPMDAYQMAGFRMFVGVSAKLGDSVQAVVSGFYGYHDYYESWGKFGAQADARLDHLLQGSLNVSYAVLDSLAVSLTATITRNDSTIFTYDYLRSQAGVSLLWRYP